MLFIYAKTPMDETVKSQSVWCCSFMVRHQWMRQ